MQNSLVDTSLDFMFKPRTIAVAGVSDKENDINMGRDFIKAFLDAGFKGALFPLNPSGGTIFGLKIWKNIRDIPEQIDYVVSAIPARFAKQLINDCADHGVKIIHFFSAGFGEIENKEGKLLQDDILNFARSHGIRIIGPNCMGIYCPASGLSFARELPNQPAFPRISGSVSFISQSGGNAIYFIRKTASNCIYCNKVVSYGNGMDINESDLLEYFASDNDTKIVAAYIEGVRDGRRFLKVLNKTAHIKPVIIFKAGESDPGTRAAASHTGAISSSKILWSNILRQTGAIQAESMDEIIDLVTLFSDIKLAKGRKALIFGTGGGASVKAADDCAVSGLELPPIPPDLRLNLIDIFHGEAGNIFKNPLDLMPILNPEKLIETVRMLTDGMSIDLLILQVAFDTWSLMERAFPIHYFIDCAIGLKSLIDKPIVSVFHYICSNEAEQLAAYERGRLLANGIPVFQSIKCAGSVINKIIQYNRGFESV